MFVLTESILIKTKTKAVFDNHRIQATNTYGNF